MKKNRVKVLSCAMLLFVMLLSACGKEKAGDLNVQGNEQNGQVADSENQSGEAALQQYEEMFEKWSAGEYETEDGLIESVMAADATRLVYASPEETKEYHYVLSQEDSETVADLLNSRSNRTITNNVIKGIINNATLVTFTNGGISRTYTFDFDAEKAESVYYTVRYTIEGAQEKSMNFGGTIDYFNYDIIRKIIEMYAMADLHPGAGQIPMRERPIFYEMNGETYQVEEYYQTIDYVIYRNLEALENEAEIIVAGQFAEDAVPADDRMVGEFKIAKVLKGDVEAESIVKISQNYTIDEAAKKILTRTMLTPMEKGGSWIYFLKETKEAGVYYVVGDYTGRYPYADFSLEKLKAYEYGIRELGLWEKNEFFVYDDVFDEVNGQWRIYHEIGEKYSLSFE